VCVSFKCIRPIMQRKQSKTSIYKFIPMHVLLSQMHVLLSPMHVLLSGSLAEQVHIVVFWSAAETDKDRNKLAEVPIQRSNGCIWASILGQIFFPVRWDIYPTKLSPPEQY
jgi:hypothetical protein